MSRRNWIYFLATGLLWGIPYLFIKVAVDPDDGFTPAAVVMGRTAIGALFLIPLAMREKSLGDARRVLKWVLLYAIFEMAIPWILIGTAEQKISSGLAGLLVASVPIWSTIFASINGDKTVWHSKRLFGILVGLVGVILLVGIESITGSSDVLSVFMVLVASMGYSYATVMITTKAPHVSGIAINGIAMVFTSVLFTPIALAQWPDHKISTNAIYSLIALGILSTGLAFALFFIVMKEIGPARASLVTYMNTAFAVVLGVAILNEPLTTGILIGLPLVLVGSYLASRKVS